MSAVSTATVLAGTSLALGAAGTGMQVFGQMNAQAAAGAQASYMAQLSRQQQQVAQMQADQVLQQGQIEADKQRQLTAQRIGTQTAALAAEGTDMAGSPADILGDTARAGAIDAETIRANATRAAWGYRVGAMNAGANAGLYGSFQPSYLGAGASLLGGASTLADKWSRFQWSSGSTYDLSRDTLRTAGDRDLAGYG